MTSNSKSVTIDRESNPRTKSFFRKTLEYLVVMVLITLLLVGGGYFLYSYKTTKYQITGVKYSNTTVIAELVEQEIKDQALVRIDTNYLKNEILKNSPMIKDINIDKSLNGGVIINVNEFQPIILIQAKDEKKYFVTEENSYIDITEFLDSDFSGFVVYYYSESIENDENIYTFSRKAREAYEKVESLNLNGRFTFDNFGNLSILMGESKVVKLDLKERFFTIDEQVKLLQDALAKTQSFTEIDLRFTYLLIK